MISLFECNNFSCITSKSPYLDDLKKNHLFFLLFDFLSGKCLEMFVNILM